MKSWTSVQETAINTYTGRGYKRINEWLRNDKPTNTGFDMADVVDDLKVLLKKLPKFNGLSYRGMNVSDDQIKNYADMKIGSIMSDKGFLSSSTRPIEVIGMASVLSHNKTAVLMAIRGKNGVYIEPASIAPYEHEVLFAPGTKLKLVRKGKLIGRGGQEVIYLELQEVE